MDSTPQPVFAGGAAASGDNDKTSGNIFGGASAQSLKRDRDEHTKKLRKEKK